MTRSRQRNDAMNQSSLVQKVWNYATVLRNEGIHYGAYISQISFLLFLKMDDEAFSQLGEPSGLPEDCRWAAIKDLQGEALAVRYSKILEKLSRHDGLLIRATKIKTGSRTPTNAVYSRISLRSSGLRRPRS